MIAEDFSVTVRALVLAAGLAFATVLLKHNYALEPNPSSTPDQKRVIFASNMFGPTYMFGVEVAKP